MQLQELATLYYQACMMPVAVYEKGHFVLAVPAQRESASLMISGADPVTGLDVDADLLYEPQYACSKWRENFIFLNPGGDLWVLGGPFIVRALDETRIKRILDCFSPARLLRTQLSRYLRALPVVSDDRCYYLGQMLRQLFGRNVPEGEISPAAGPLRVKPSLAEPALRQTYSLPVRQAMRYIDEHLKSDLKAKKIAAAAGVNKDYLSALFKKETGTAMMVYIQQRRSAEACKLLKTTRLTVKTIAGKFGFSSSSNFTNVFKKHLNMTPIEYRKKEYQ